MSDSSNSDSVRAAAKPSASDVSGLMLAAAGLASSFETQLKALPGELSLKQWMLLSLLRDGSEARLSQLTRKAGVSRQLGWQVVKRLEAQGLISTTATGEVGKKMVHVRIADAGRAVLEQFEAMFSAVAEKVSDKPPAIRVPPARRALNSISTAMKSASRGTTVST